MSAVTCRFERRNCRHPSLFQSEYKRTNRTKKTKILRCFPHCCPEHLNRSYCGASLSVRVELVTAAQQQTTTTASNPASLLVFAHFEEAQTNFVSLNDVLDYNDVTGSVQTEQTPKGTWIQGAVVRDAAVDHSCLFQINPGARWYYEWESAATKAQRFTKHALRVYVFQRVQSQLRVVGLVSSSEFMVVSYRRAPSEVRAEREALEALRTAATTQQGAETEDYSHANARAASSTERQAPTPHSSRQVDGREEELWKDRKLWECRHPDIMTSSKQLAVLYYFLRYLDASSFLACLDQLSILFRDQVAGYRSVTSKNREEDDHAMKDAEPPLSWAFFESLGNSETNLRFDDGGETGEGKCDSLARLAQICTNLAGWLALGSANLEIYRRFLRSYGAALLDKNRVRAGYVEAVKLMCKLVDRFTGWSEDPSVSTSTSLSLLSEEIMTAVFKYDRLKPLRRVLLGVLSSHTMFGMHEFVAQLRAQYLLQQAHTLSTRNGLARREGNHESVFDGAWVFNGRRSSLALIQGSSASGISLGCLLTFMRELARVTVRAVDGQSLEVCSDWNVCGVQPGQAPSPRSNDSGVSLVLDSQQRVFSNFPSGLSSTIPLGAHSYGDYRGKITSSNSFVVEMSSWPLDSSGTHSAHRWKLQVDVESIDQARESPSCLVVKAVVEEGYWRIDGRNEAPDFQAMPFSLKHQVVKAWYPTYELVGVYDRAK
ncbi:hypothetical protein PRIC1_014587 [Phytophthora ramorum]